MLVNDIWGGEQLFEWNTPLWEHDLDKGLRMLRLAIDTHLITSHFALPLLIRRPGGLVVEMTDGTREYNAAHYRVSAFYDLAKTRGLIRLAFAQGRGARAARLHRRGAHAGLAALGDDARQLRRHRGELARRRGGQPALRRDLREPALRGPRGRRAGRRPGRPAPQRRLVLLRRAGARVRLHRRRRLAARLLALHGVDGVRRRTIPLAGYDHFGDPDVHDGTLYIPLEGKRRIFPFVTVPTAYRASPPSERATCNSCGPHRCPTSRRPAGARSTPRDPSLLQQPRHAARRERRRAAVPLPHRAGRP